MNTITFRSTSKASLHSRAARGSLTACAALLWGAMPLSALAADDNSTPPTPTSEVVIVATSPLPGTGIDINKIPGNVQTLKSGDISAEGVPSVLGSMNKQLSSININEDLDDPFQPDILYHGFEASPVLGVSSGLAVYQNGVRVNEPFGDIVNWDLIPDIAVDRIDLVDSNPVYGLNALGGALSVTTKNGFSYTGADADYSFGSFRREQESAEFGANNGTFGVYAAANLLHQDGYRFFAGDDIHQYYLALSYRNDILSLDLSYVRADNTMFGQGAAPVQSLAISDEEVFTGPQSYENKVDFLTLNGTLKLADQVSLQGVVYYRNFRQAVSNGNTTDYEPCTDPSQAQYLCQPDGTNPLMNGAAPGFIPDISQGGNIPIGENDFEFIHSDGKGGSLQFNTSLPIASHGNQFTAGLALDRSTDSFYSGAQIGVLNPQLVQEPSDYYVYTPESPEQVANGYAAVPVILGSSTSYSGYYLTDTFDVTKALSATASARYNVAQVDLTDESGTGTALSGENHFTHFNPSLGLTYSFSQALNAFAGWSVNNRAPTASEIECANPLQPCLLPADLAGDPPLKQVISHTYEFGLRGTFADASSSGHFSWNVDAFRTLLENDIYAISTSLNTGFFQNVGSTERQGIDAAFKFQSRRLTYYVQYSYTEATFGSAFVENSSSNPFADDNGNIQVNPGDRIPGVPLHRFKAGVDIEVLPRWTVGANVVIVSPQFYKGDESNQNAELPGYHVFDLTTNYQFTSHIEVFGTIQNLFNEHYATFGTLSDPTGINAPGIPTDGSFVDARFISPAAPFSFFAGVRLRL